MTPGAPSDSTEGPLGVGSSLRIEVPAGGPLYAGHFPGQPILPGVALLMLALRTLQRAGAPPVLLAIDALRLRRQATPGASIDLVVEALDPEGRLRFRLGEAEARIATASIVLGDAPRPVAARGAAGLETADRTVSALNLDALLPHRPPMRWVERVERITPQGAQCAARVPEGCALVHEGRLPSFAALELAAQAAAVFEAMSRQQAPVVAPAVGYLVGARGVQLASASLPVAETLHVEVTRTGLAPPLSTFDFELRAGRAVVANGSVSTWLALG